MRNIRWAWAKHINPAIVSATPSANQVKGFSKDQNAGHSRQRCLGRVQCVTYTTLVS